MNHALVGAFVLLLVTALIAGALWLASGGALRKQYDLYLAIEDESVAGLNVNAPVKYNGVEVGKVRDIELDRSNPERVRLLLAIERGTPVKEDTLAVLKTQGLTGIAYVELGGSTAASPPLQVGEGEIYPVIHTKPSLSTRLENVLTTVLAKLDSTSSNIDAILSDANREALSRTLANMAAVSESIAARRDSIDAGIANAKICLFRSSKKFFNCVPRGISAHGNSGRIVVQARDGGEVIMLDLCQSYIWQDHCTDIQYEKLIAVRLAVGNICPADNATGARLV